MLSQGLLEKDSDEGVLVGHQGQCQDDRENGCGGHGGRTGRTHDFIMTQHFFPMKIIKCTLSVMGMKKIIDID